MAAALTTQNLFSQVIKLAMGGQASPLDGPYKGTRPNKRNVRGIALNVINNKSQLSESDLAARMVVAETLGLEGEHLLFMSITAWNLAFYCCEKQLTFQKTVSLKHRQKSILEMFNKS